MNIDDLKLNPSQREALDAKEGPVLIIAGAGTGKTKTLTSRIAHLIEQGERPEEIIAITFTNKAAKEMRDRVNALITHPSRPYDPTGPFIGTFHALGLSILRENREHFGLPQHFSILDRRDSKKALTEALKKEDLDPKEHDAGKILGIISKHKSAGILPSTKEGILMNQNNPLADIFPAVWRRYESILEKENSVDFDDLLLKPVTFLHNTPEARKRYRKRWKWVHVDEYQDTNHIQYMLSSLISEHYKNICVVGDPDQTIYTWRGANIENIMRFERDYPGAKVVILNENYRSTQTILTAANDIIKVNKERKEKDLITKNTEGERIEVIEATNESEEAQEVAGKIRELLDTGVPSNEIGVLYRANFQSRVLEEVFISYGIPYLASGTKFLDRQEIKDVVAFLRLSLSPENEGDMRRIINTPPRGIGKVAFLKILEGRDHELPAKTKKNLDQFRELLREINTLSQASVSKAVMHIIKKAGFEEYFRKYNDEERLENVQELVTLATRYDTDGGVEAFLEHISLFSEQDSFEGESEGVRLMTVHGAKGLEFDHVFITGLENELFPHTTDMSGKSEREEERRLFYVALTRARKKATLSYANMRTIYGSLQSNAPSPFIEEIDEALVDRKERSLLFKIDF